MEQTDGISLIFCESVYGENRNNGVQVVGILPLCLQTGLQHY